MSKGTLSIDKIPWSRIVHWYGRATEYPAYFESIKNGNTEVQAEAKIQN